MISDTVPEYMDLDDEEISTALGPEIASRIFSEEFTDFRVAALLQTIPEAPEIGMAMLDIYPYRLETGEMTWIERYVVKGEHEFGRSIMMLLDGNSLQFAHLVPGRTKASPKLQRDALRDVFMLIMNESGIEGWSKLEQDEALAKRGIPEVWPSGCPVSVFDSVVTQEPDEEGKAWSERWGFQAGDVAILVDIYFSGGPDGNTLILPRIVEQ